MNRHCNIYRCIKEDVSFEEIASPWQALNVYRQSSRFSQGVWKVISVDRKLIGRRMNLRKTDFRAEKKCARSFNELHIMHKYSNSVYTFIKY